MQIKCLHPQRCLRFFSLWNGPEQNQTPSEQAVESSYFLLVISFSEAIVSAIPTNEKSTSKIYFRPWQKLVVNRLVLWPCRHTLSASLGKCLFSYIKSLQLTKYFGFGRSYYSQSIQSQARPCSRRIIIKCKHHYIVFT